jgi:hypothetical protein
MRFARTAYYAFSVILRKKKSIILWNSINPFFLVTDTVCVLFEEEVFVIGTHLYCLRRGLCLQILNEILAL